MLVEMGRKTEAQDGLYYLSDLAGYLACSRAYVRKLIACGTIPPIRIGTLRRVRKSDGNGCFESRLSARDES